MWIRLLSTRAIWVFALMAPVPHRAVPNGKFLNGKSLNVDLDKPPQDAIYGFPPGSIPIEGCASIGPGATPNSAVVTVIDVSSSTKAMDGCGGDCNNDGESNTRLDCECASALALNEKAIEQGVPEVALVKFSKDADSLLTPPFLPPENPQVVTAIKSLDFGRGTNFGDAVELTCDIINNSASVPNVLVLFLSDGFCNKRCNEINRLIMECPETVTFITFAVGDKARCTDELQEMADKTGGRCVEVENFADLETTLPEAIADPSVLTSVSATVNGVVDEVDTVPRLPQTGPVEVCFREDWRKFPGIFHLCVEARGKNFMDREDKKDLYYTNYNGYNNYADYKVYTTYLDYLDYNNYYRDDAYEQDTEYADYLEYINNKDDVEEQDFAAYFDDYGYDNDNNEYFDDFGYSGVLQDGSKGYPIDRYRDGFRVDVIKGRGYRRKDPVARDCRRVTVATIMLTPQHDSCELGTKEGKEHIIVVTVAAGRDGGVKGVFVQLKIVSGPNKGTVFKGEYTDRFGKAKYIYYPKQGYGGAGTDVLMASFTDDNGYVASATATKEWTLSSGVPKLGDDKMTIKLLPEWDSSKLGSAKGNTHTVTAIVESGYGAKKKGVNVKFAILEGPNKGATVSIHTDAYGNAEFTYYAVQGRHGIGIDVIEAYFVNNKWQTISAIAKKEWIYAPQKPKNWDKPTMISLAPEWDSSELGSYEGNSHTLIATVKTGYGKGVAGVYVNFEIFTGPNKGKVYNGKTDAYGKVEYTYYPLQGMKGKGTDVIKASFENYERKEVGAIAKKEWTYKGNIDGPRRVALTPEWDSCELGTPEGKSHTVTASVSSGYGKGVEGVSVKFEVSYGPNQGKTFQGRTDQYGNVDFTYYPIEGYQGVGSDLIKAIVWDSEGNMLTATADKEWTYNPVKKNSKVIELNPKSATMQLGTSEGQSHTVTATVKTMYGDAVTDGIYVMFDIISGPNQGYKYVGYTDSYGRIDFTYYPIQGPDGAGTDKIKASFRGDDGSDVSDTAEKIWIFQALSYGYPPQGNDYQTPGNGYPTQGNDYETPGNRYPTQGNDYQAPGYGYPPQGNDYQAPGYGYPPQGNDYQAPGYGYPPQGNDYQAPGYGYPPQGNDYQGTGYGNPPQGNDYQPSGYGYPPQGNDYQTPGYGNDYSTQRNDDPGRLELSPLYDSCELGKPDCRFHSVTATVAVSSGYGVNGVNVDFRVISGPNSGESASGRTDQFGKVKFTYFTNQRSKAGLDVIEASFINRNWETVTATARQEWTQSNNYMNMDDYADKSTDDDEPKSIKVTPEADSAVLGTPQGKYHTVTVTVSSDFGNGVGGVFVSLDILSGPNKGENFPSQFTDGNGQVMFTYHAIQGRSGEGTDVLEAMFTDKDGRKVSAVAVKEWLYEEDDNRNGYEPAYEPNGDYNNGGNKDSFKSVWQFLGDILSPYSVNETEAKVNIAIEDKDESP